MIILFRENLKYQSIKYGGDEASRSHLGMAVTDGESGGKDVSLKLKQTLKCIESEGNYFCQVSS